MFNRTKKLTLIQGSHRLEKYLNLKGFLEKSLKIKSALKSTGKSLKSLETSFNSKFYTNFPVLMSPLFQSSISEEDFFILRSVFFINIKSLKTFREAFRSP